MTLIQNFKGNPRKNKETTHEDQKVSKVLTSGNEVLRTNIDPDVT